MTTPPSSRAEVLIREAISLGAEEIFLQGNGEGANIRYRVAGFIVQEAQRKIADFQGFIADLKSHLSPDADVFDDSEWSGQFSLLVEERTTWIQVLWLQDRSTEAVAIRILSRSFGFDDLGLSPRDGATLDELISAPQGVIVGCGTAKGGHATTLNALLERLAQQGKRVASLADESDPRLNGVTQIEVTDNDFGEQVEILAGHFDVFALGNLCNSEKVRAAFDLAADGHLVLGLVYSPPVSAALLRFLDSGISPEELRSHFLGGWSQRLVRHANGQERVGLFHCFISDEANQPPSEEETLRAFQLDAQEKLTEGLITREEVERNLASL